MIRLLFILLISDEISLITWKQNTLTQKVYTLKEYTFSASVYEYSWPPVNTFLEHNFVDLIKITNH